MIRRLILATLLFTAIAAIAAPPAVEASCFYPGRSVTRYYAWISRYDGSVFCASENYNIGPPLQGAYTWEEIGETGYDCDGNYYQWGDTSCTAGVQHAIVYDCPRVCQ